MLSDPLSTAPHWINPVAAELELVVDNTANQVTATKNDGGSAGEGGKAGTHPQPEQALLGVGHGALAGGFGVEHDLENG